MKKKKTFRFTTVYIIVMSLLLLLTNVILGVVLMARSVKSVTALVRRSMLNNVSTAAEIVNGDRLGSLTEKDVGGPVFEEVKEELSAFQNNIDIEYIYAVKQIDEDTFIFTVDADPEDPADFGEEVLVTDALRSAARGVPMVDESPAEDEWGNFYSAYCPVLDSKGEIAGIIGIDFDSKWFDEQVYGQTASIGIITLIAVLIGALIVSFMSRTLTSRFAPITQELSALSDDIDRLNQEIQSAGNNGEAGKSQNPDAREEPEARDEIEEISYKVSQMHDVMRRTLEYMQAKANTDGLTGVGNRTAYIEMMEKYEAGIRDQSARFALIVFDVNDLKKINDSYGHNEGDRIIIDAAELLETVFGKGNVYRIGGDEFLGVLDQTDEAGMNAKLAELENAVRAYNEKTSAEEGELSIAAGGSCYRPGIDHSFQEVFVRADESMYQKKGEYHRKRGTLWRDPKGMYGPVEEEESGE